MNYDFLFYWSLLLGVFLLIIWQKLWEPFLLDKFRHEIFELRDKLFDIAATGNIEFTDENYLYLRDYLNSSLRYAHRLTVTDFIINILLSERIRKLAADLKVDTSNMLKSIKEEHVRNQMISIYEQTKSISARYFIRRTTNIFIFASPLILISIIPIGVFSLRKTKLKTRKIIQSKMDPFWELPMLERTSIKMENEVRYSFHHCT